MSRLNPFLKRLAIALSAFTATAVVAASSAPTNAMAAPTVAQPRLTGYGFDIPGGSCRGIAPVPRGQVYFCVSTQGPSLGLGNPATGCVFNPASQYNCTPVALAYFFGL
jgi:streptogramin lyase